MIHDFHTEGEAQNEAQQDGDQALPYQMNSLIVFN